VSRVRPPLTPGIYRVADAVRAGDALGRAGWDVRHAAAARSSAELYPALATALALPSWFGANLDALWDGLADLDRPTALVLTGWDRFAAAEPDDARRFLDLFADRVREDPPFVVLLVG
jgi:RNAse (barnase) inhibitor barstar